ncbi:arsenate reductase (glutaredoxin) [Stenotrophomonas sp. ZAC14D2_NAIMI4_7]|uniref:arsenate reductase (glutaredoxin) n=1 Tax=Stenotrophomonas sp. ZAC14D2_NAIMI4_7 TaxID=2072405 RepID=UPI000D53E0F5|nr:arsenate reductase (glutaredoxin) [Stenotrophomonas sp. ZAC14D2_NAIMI4_7]AWH18081.1 arsenate reductase (glutaredoxin) [Stenotrophomonas sp. ZAC14D2_NAIMI4_7]
MAVTIWHNPACSNSRGALALIRDAGIEPLVVDYLGNPPDVATLRAVLAESGLTARELVRSKEAQFAELGLAGADDAALLAAMAEHPRLINRPVVRTPKGTRLCRPPERALDLL